MIHHFEKRTKSVGIWLLFVFATIIVVALTFFLGFGVGVIAFKSIPMAVGTGIFPTIGIFVVITRRIRNIPTYAITPEEIQITSRKQTIQIPFKDSRFESFTTNIRYGGISSGAVQTLGVIREGKQERYNINLSKKEFTRFLQMIETYSSQM